MFFFILLMVLAIAAVCSSYIALMPAQVTSLETEKNLARVFEALLTAVKKGEIPIEQIDQSVERILQLKINRGIIDHTGSEPLQKKIKYALKTVGSNKHMKSFTTGSFLTTYDPVMT